MTSAETALQQEGLENEGSVSGEGNNPDFAASKAAHRRKLSVAGSEAFLTGLPDLLTPNKLYNTP